MTTARITRNLCTSTVVPDSPGEQPRCHIAGATSRLWARAPHKRKIMRATTCRGRLACEVRSCRTSWLRLRAKVKMSCSSWSHRKRVGRKPVHAVGVRFRHERRASARAGGRRRSARARAQAGRRLARAGGRARAGRRRARSLAGGRRACEAMGGPGGRARAGCGLRVLAGARRARARARPRPT